MSGNLEPSSWRHPRESRKATPRHAFTISEFCQSYGIGRTRLFQEVKSGRLLTYVVGRRRYISVTAAEFWQRQLEAMAIKADLNGEATHEHE